MGLFSRKTPTQKLQDRYKKLMGDYHKLSKTDRKAADGKYAEAEEVLKQIDALAS